MGAAKSRGTFEERKAKAIAEGRVKTPKKSINRIMREVLDEISTGDPLVDMVSIMEMGKKKRNG